MEEIGDDRIAEVLDRIRVFQWVEEDEICLLRQVIHPKWKMFPVVDLALAFSDPWLSDNYRRDIILWLNKLNLEIDKMTDYFSTNVKGEAELLQHKTIIQKGLKISMTAATAKNFGEKRKLLVGKVMPLFCSSTHIFALRAVINELTTRCSMLEDIYNKTNGHWPKMKMFLDRILPLIVGALIATAVDATCTSENAAQSLKAYRGQMEEIENKIQIVFDRCRTDFKENMLKDLEEVLNQGVSNDTAVDKLSDLMKEKYDWLVNHCIICDESINLNYCFLGNNYVKCLERNGKFGVIFYRDAVKDEIVDYEKRKKVESVLAELAKNSSTYTTAEDLGQTVINNCKTEGIEVCACAVMRPKAALQWIPFYGTGAMMAYGTAVRKLHSKGTCVTVREYLVNDPIRMNSLLDILVLPLVITETIVDHVRGGGVKPRFFSVLYKP